MNRKLLTGLTVASVAGTGGVAYATVAGPADNAPAAATSTVATTAATAPVTSASTTSSSEVDTTLAGATPRTITYQVGDAGSVTVEVANGALASRGIAPAEGWAVTTMSNSASHTELTFASAERAVGFTADLVGSEVVVSVTNDRLPGALGSDPVQPLPVSVIDDSDDPTPPTSASVPATLPVIPATAPATPETAPSMTAPPTASTSAPSGSTGTYSGDDDEHEGHSSDSAEHGSEPEDGGGDD